MTSGIDGIAALTDVVTDRAFIAIRKHGLSLDLTRCLAALSMLIAALPGTTLALLGAGGLLYTGGVAFHLWRRLPGQNAVWHGFVLTAAACHYVAVLRTLTG